MSEGEEELNVGAVRLEEVASAANVMLRGGWVIAPQKLWHRWQG